MRLEYFQLIDRIAEINIADRTIRTEAKVPLQSTIFEGHFPGHPLMPGVLLIESMAQTAGWLILGLLNFERMPFLFAVRDAKLRQFVPPGQALSLSAELVHEGSGYAVARAAAAAAGKAVCNAELSFRLMEFPTDQFRTFIEEWAKRIEFPLGARADG